MEDAPATQETCLAYEGLDGARVGKRADTRVQLHRTVAGLGHLLDLLEPDVEGAIEGERVHGHLVAEFQGRGPASVVGGRLADARRFVEIGWERRHPVDLVGVVVVVVIVWWRRTNARLER